MLQNPPTASIDGIRLDLYKAGIQYDVGNLIGAVLLASGWAEPVAAPEPSAVVPVSDENDPPNLTREFFPPYYDGPPQLAKNAIRRRRR